MVKRADYESAVARACHMLEQAGIFITAAERERFEVADFGLGELEKTGLELITYVNTDRVCAKEILLFPQQTCPEHRHPAIGKEMGKEETFRCRWGSVYLYIPGSPSPAPACRPPAGSEPYYTVWHEVRLQPGDQYTLLPDTPHWFQAGAEGAIVSEFSTRSTDEADLFSDPRIRRMPVVAET